MDENNGYMSETQTTVTYDKKILMMMFQAIREDERKRLSKLFALNHVPCDNPSCLCQTKEFEAYWKGAGIERRTSKR